MKQLLPPNTASSIPHRPPGLQRAGWCGGPAVPWPTTHVWFCHRGFPGWALSIRRIGSKQGYLLQKAAGNLPQQQSWSDGGLCWGQGQVLLPDFFPATQCQADTAHTVPTHAQKSKSGSPDAGCSCFMMCKVWVYRVSPHINLSLCPWLPAAPQVPHLGGSSLNDSTGCI